MTAIFVSGFDYGTDEAALKEHFETVGDIKEVYFQSKGAAVITYETRDAALKALNELHETTMKDQSRYVAVKFDQKKTAAKGSGKGSESSPGKGTAIYISGFDFRTTDEDTVRAHFSGVGKIQDLYFQSKGSAVITYQTAGAASRAVEQLHESTMEGQTRYVAVKLDDPNREGKGEGKGDWYSKGSGKGKGAGKSKGKGKDKGKDKRGPEPGTSVYVSGFDFETDERALSKHFSTVGEIQDLYFQSNGAAVITYATFGAADRAVEQLHETTIKGQSRYCAVKIDEHASGKGKSKGKGKGKGKGK